MHKSLKLPPNSTSLYEFVKLHREDSREGFLERVTETHVLLQQNLNRSSGFQTLAGGQTPDKSDTDSPCPDSGFSQPLMVVIPLRKRPGANTFSSMITVGRANNNDIVIRNPAVSKFHAYFRETTEGWLLTDADSTNGTHVDDTLVEPRTSVLVGSEGRIALGDQGTELVLLPPEELFELVLASS